MFQYEKTRCIIVKEIDYLPSIRYFRNIVKLFDYFWRQQEEI